MPKPSPITPEPESRKPPQKVALTPEQIAAIVAGKLKRPVGSPEKVEIPLKVVLPRAVAERLMARVSREKYASLASFVQAVLEREGQPEAEGRRRTGG